ncbi:283_t:CDS:2 [Ambispora leptoticha]|uniref:283_t:CDS:1 n=1 Tax=Ambispora leptoticha TaxID=144679 RepID=A0A9N9GNT9_9GLOM|nr:283_t:CDS:2 [Ambispora leptoticha]
MSESPKRDLTIEEKRRKRRQQKILQGAGDRLHRITTVHGGETPSLFTSPMPSQQSSPTSSDAPFNPVISSRKCNYLKREWINNSSNNDQISSSIIHEKPESGSLASSSSMPHIKTPTKEYLRQMLENMRKHNISTGSFTSTSGAGGDTSLPGEFNVSSKSSLEEQQQQLFQSSLLSSSEETSPQTMFPFLSPEMRLLGSTFGIGIGGQNNSKNSRAKTWQLIHFVVTFSLALYIVSYKLLFGVNSWHHFNYLIYDNPNYLSNNELSIPLFWYFITLELILHATRFFLDQQQLQENKPFHDSINFVPNLPYPLPQVITILMRYRLIWNNFWEDLCTMVFVFGITITFSSFFAYWLPRQ